MFAVSAGIAFAVAAAILFFVKLGKSNVITEPVIVPD